VDNDDWLDPEPLDPKARAREKQASRDEDDRALALGLKSREDLARENGAFAFPSGLVRIVNFPSVRG
jgi:hypothetical protein